MCLAQSHQLHLSWILLHTDGAFVAAQHRAFARGRHGYWPCNTHISIG